MKTFIASLTLKFESTGKALVVKSPDGRATTIAIPGR